MSPITSSTSPSVSAPSGVPIAPPAGSAADTAFNAGVGFNATIPFNGRVTLAYVGITRSTSSSLTAPSTPTITAP